MLFTNSPSIWKGYEELQIQEKVLSRGDKVKRKDLPKSLLKYFKSSSRDTKFMIVKNPELPKLILTIEEKHPQVKKKKISKKKSSNI